MSDWEDNIVTSTDSLAALYKEPIEHIATKDLDYVNAAGRAFIAASPFLVLATGSRRGLDCSPKGDRPGFVEVADNGRNLFIPDACESAQIRPSRDASPSMARNL